MPRPSDVYATLGAPGIHQATPASPPHQLPNVYVFPPEEDDADVFCLFHSASASPSTFESFYSNILPSQRDLSSPVARGTVVNALNQTISYFQEQPASTSPVQYVARPSWEDTERTIEASSNNGFSPTFSTSSHSSSDSPRRLSAENEPYVDMGEEDGWERHNQAPRPASRRSSVFGDRPPDYNPPQGEDQTGTQKSQTLTTSIKSRAVMALRKLGGGKAKQRAASHVTLGEDVKATNAPVIYESWFEAESLQRKHSRRGLGQIFGSSSMDVTTASVKGAERSKREVKLDRRKSMTQILGIARASMDNAPKAEDDQLFTQHATLPPSFLPVGSAKISKRRSMTQLLRLTRAPSYESHTTELAHRSTNEGRPTSPRISDVSSFRLSTSSRPSLSQSTRSEFPMVTASDPAPSKRRKSFLNGASFSFLDLHRHFSTSPSSDSPSAQHDALSNALNSPSSTSSENTDSSSSVLASMDSETVGDDLPSFIGLDMPGLDSKDTNTLVNTHPPKLELLDFSHDIHLSPHLDLHIPDDRVISAAVARPMELLDSFNFDALVFDTDSFAEVLYK